MRIQVPFLHCGRVTICTRLEGRLVEAIQVSQSPDGTTQEEPSIWRSICVQIPISFPCRLQVTSLANGFWPLAASKPNLHPRETKVGTVLRAFLRPIESDF